MKKKINALKKPYKKAIIIALAVLLVCLTIWILWENNALELNYVAVCSNRLPERFEGFRIAQVSDLHNTQFGKNNRKLLDLLRESQPDIIVITGDLIDSYDTNIAIALDFAEAAVQIAPCYYVPGNHEARCLEYRTLKTGLEAAGVTVLDDEKVRLERGNEAISVIGVNDPGFWDDFQKEIRTAVMLGRLSQLYKVDDGYTVLLSHRPELFSTYALSGVDLVLSGHAHGGQFRLPFVGGLYAPNQGFFPKYDAGLYTKGNTTMVVSRGIGNSVFPIRINNRPEVVVVELTCH